MVDVKDENNYKDIAYNKDTYTWESEVIVNDVSQGVVTFDVYMIGQGADVRVDGCFGAVDVTKTLIENTTYYGTAGEKDMFFVTVRTANACRKVDFTGKITAATTNSQPDV
jgi:hypothetical protein